MFASRLLVTLLCALPLTPALAHEFWIEPEDYQVAPGETIRADFKNGQEFKGITLSFFDRSSLRYDVLFNEEVRPVLARSGDSPALSLAAPARDGLFVVVHETAPTLLTYKEWEKFGDFARHKDFTTALDDHDAAGWPREDFKERYTRHVKALIAVGSGAGEDEPLGLETEFVALTNPYAAEFGNEMEVLLTYRDAPRADAQVEVFERNAADEVTITLHRTDSNGQATIPVKAGHDYLFDAVVLRPAPDAGQPDAPVWETLWAALTFAVPE